MPDEEDIRRDSLHLLHELVHAVVTKQWVLGRGVHHGEFCPSKFEHCKVRKTREIVNLIVR
jgi:hypothetical protein